MQWHQHAAGPVAKGRCLFAQSGLEVGTVGHTHGSGQILKMDPTIGRDLLENTFQVMKLAKINWHIKR